MSIPLEAAEARMLKEFKRRAHQFLPHAEVPTNDLEWLALLQHCGAPTRLLDWTRSPYVAAYFAHENAGNAPCAIWCISSIALKDASIAYLDDKVSGDERDLLSVAMDFSEPQVFETFVYPGKYPVVVPVEPPRLNVRMGSQQGLFVCAGDLDKGFTANLRSLLSGGPFTRPKKLLLRGGARHAILEDLTRMNISRATLFPGLDGLAQSLRLAVQLEKNPLLAMRRQFESKPHS